MSRSLQKSACIAVVYCELDLVFNDHREYKNGNALVVCQALDRAATPEGAVGRGELHNVPNLFLGQTLGTQDQTPALLALG
jgi:hypothetical protein